MNALVLSLIIAATGVSEQVIRTPTVVFELTSDSFEAAQRRTLSEELRTELARFEALAVVGAEDLKRMIESAAGQELSGCSDNSCMSQLSEALGATQFITGNVGRLDDRWVVHHERAP